MPDQRHRAEANPLVLLLARIGVAIAERRIETDRRRRTIGVVEGQRPGGEAA